MYGIRFSLLLKDAMTGYGVGPTKLEELLQERGVYNISYKRISEYIRSVSTPSLEKAAALMNALEFPIDRQSLSESLELNRELIREEREEQELLLGSGYSRTLNVHIRLRNLMPERSPLDSERRVLERVNELYGSGDIVRYVESLIAFDLKNSILKGDREQS